MRTLAILFALSGSAALALAAPRTFTDSTGQFRVEAEFVEFKEGKVHLKKEDGTLLQLSMSKLSREDQAWVREEITRRKSGAPTEEVAARDDSSAENSSDGWPGWRGPDRDGISDETGLLKSWPEGGPQLAWSADGIGGGFSSVAVTGGKIYTMGNRNGKQQLICLNEKDGKELWSADVAGGGDPNCTPVVDGDLVFGLARGGELAAVSTETGKVVWQKHFERDFGGKMMSGWGYSESPLVDGDHLICTPGGPRAILAALNKKTGEPVWQTAMPYGGNRGQDGAGYSSVVISNAAGVKQYVQLVGRGVVGVSAKDGSLLWGYDRVANTTANIPTPVVTGDYVFCSSGYGDGGTALLKITGRGGKLSAQEVYYLPSNKTQNHHGGMILIGNHLYMGHGHNNGFPLCLDVRSGEDVWRPGRGAGSGSAAIAYADGHLYFRYQSGDMALIEATPEEYRLKGEFRIASRHGESWPHPVISGGKLYLRDQHQLHCYDVQAK